MMEPHSNEVAELIGQSKRLKEATQLKSNLEVKLAQLTLCNNVSTFSTNRSEFNSNVLRISCKVVPGIGSSTQHIIQTLIICATNVSEKIIFNSAYWQFHIAMNDEKTQIVFDLKHCLSPGESEEFCCPLSDMLGFKQPVQKVQVRLKFTTTFESKIYTRAFDAEECVVDVLHCLDPGRLLSAPIWTPPENLRFAAASSQKSGPKPPMLFPSVNKFLLKLDPSLKKRFVKDILLCDSMHRGFHNVNEFCSDSPSDLAVFYMGHKIEISSIKDDTIAVQCSNPSILFAMKASILRRLVLVSNIEVEGLERGSKEKIHEIRLRSNAFRTGGDSCAEVDELMELYLDLRDVSESIRFTAFGDD